MYNSQEIALRIRETAKIRKIPIGQLLEKCDLNINYISELGKGKQASALNISKIADYLEVSTDYLLGRTDNKNGYSNNNQITNNSNFGDNSISIDSKQNNDETTNELVTIFKQLSFSDKAKVMSLVAELSEKERA